ncbi:MAG: sigma-54-dependent Fis family transcriptional regulator [Gemmatimonadales bacterium]|nr:MAG: sigma-54-dependent Fis family transcriptional regulator [Gemmatimonadales bacterium]
MTTANPIRILLVDDEQSIVQTLSILFRGAGYEVIPAVGGKAGLEALEAGKPDLVVSDIRMPGTTGLEVLARAREVDPELPVILMTAQASLQTAVQAVNQGAFYYIQKPFSNDELLAICSRAVETRALKVENRELKKEIRRRGGGSRVDPIGKASAFQEALTMARTVAPTDSTILITGESGTGKEVMARYIHDLSHRSEGPFFSINCGALPESLLESELFGHVKGSFTGAVKDKTGLLVAAGGGTFLLDEVGETSPKTQVKLLRALQEREVIPVGATQAVPMDARIIAATNRDLDEQIRKGEFRSDLYYRLNVINLKLPALRDRREDIPLLAKFFLERTAEGEKGPRELSEEALEALLAYDWPGNVRELENALERAAVLAAKKGEIPAEALPDRVREKPQVQLVSADPPPNPPMEIIERAYIEWVLNAEGGNKSRAAEVLGIDPSTLYRKIARYGLNAGG